MMNCNDIKTNIPAYIDNQLDAQTSEAVKSHLESCASCRAEYTELKSFLQFTDSLPEVEPPIGMKEEFLKMADELEIPVQKKIVVIPMWAKVAAMVVLAVGTYVAGYQKGSVKSEYESQQLAAELNTQKQAVLLASLRDYTSPQKIEAVYTIGNSGYVNNELVDALVHTMNSDKSVNVRLAAITALSGMMDSNEQVKEELIKSLRLQENSLLQISLIQVLTESGVKEAKDEIENITQDEKADENVKAFAKDMIKTII